MEQPSEEKKIEQKVAELSKQIDSLHDGVVYGKAKIEAWKEEGLDSEDNEKFLTVMQGFELILPKIRDSFASFLSWNKRLQAESNQNRDLLLKLLGLRPDASSLEIAEAFDDVSEIMAGYRRQRRRV